MEYMTVKEASKLWGYSESTIREWCRNDRIILIFRAKKVNNRWYIPRDAICPKITK